MSKYTFQKPNIDFTVDYQTLQDIIREHFNKSDFRFLDHIYDVRNDTYQVFEVGCATTYYEQEITDWVSGKDNQVYAGLLLDRLAEQDVIPDGNYLVKISW